MQCTIKCVDIASDKSFLSMSKNDYVTIGISKKTILLICDSKELYIHLNFDVISGKDLSDAFSFYKINKKSFLALWIDGLTTFSVIGDILRVEYADSNGHKSFKYESNCQPDIASSYLERLNILQHLEEFPKVNLAANRDIMKIAKNLQIPLKATDGYLFLANKGYMIYKEYSGSPFACYSGMLNFLASQCNTVYNVKNTLVYSDKNRVAIVTKIISPQSCDAIITLKRQRAESRVKIDIKNIVSFLSKIHPKDDGIFTLDLERKVGIYANNGSNYEISIEVSDIQLSKSTKAKFQQNSEVGDLDLAISELDVMGQTEKEVATIEDNTYHIPVLKIPMEILNKIFPQLNTARIITIEIKSLSIILKALDTFIVFRRNN